MASAAATASLPGARSALVVDDDPLVARVERRFLEAQGFAVELAASADAGVLALAGAAFDLLVSDLALPDGSGMTVIEAAKRFGPSGPAVLVVTGLADVREAERVCSAGVHGYLVKPFSEAQLVIAARQAMRLHELELRQELHARELEEAVRDRTHEAEASRVETILRLARLAEFRDDATGEHAGRVGELSARLADVIGCDADVCDRLRLAAALHDVGKVAVPDEILRKAGPLDADERRVMERHAATGHSILSGSGNPLLDVAAEIALTHHERVDGRGYPNGLSGLEIPLSGRIVAVADSFDALTSDRPYRGALTPAQALATMRADGGHYDELVLTALALLGGHASR